MRSEGASGKDLLGRLFGALASVRLAVVVMTALAAACIAATFYESAHGTPAAQRDFYQTGWFAALLVLLGINVLFSMMKRLPWNKHHAGFVMAHVGILAILLGSLVSLHLGLDSSMALFEGESSDRVTLLDQALHVTLPGQAHRNIPVDLDTRPPLQGRERRFPVPGNDVTLVAEAFHPHVRTVERFEAASEPNPVLHYVLEGPMARDEGWLAASDPARRHVDYGPISIGFHAASTEAEARHLSQHAVGQNQVSFVLGPDGRLIYGLTTRQGAGPAGRVEVGRPIETPWMGMKVTVDRFLPRTAIRREVLPEPLPQRDGRRFAAVRVRLEGPSGRSSPEWLLWTEERSLSFAGGEASVGYGPSDEALPFRVTLLDFNSEKYPGSGMAATYESRVRVEDPERGVSEHLISMNRPLHHRGYVFFQSSFVEGQPMMSIFSVARAPGLPLVYLGTTLLTLGVAWMFYVKPYLARRQAARALQAQAARPAGSRRSGRRRSSEPARV